MHAMWGSVVGEREGWSGGGMHAMWGSVVGEREGWSEEGCMQCGGV